jgi:hypothetical protein
MRSNPGAGLWSGSGTALASSAAISQFLMLAPSPLAFAFDDAQHFEVRPGKTLLRTLGGTNGVLACPSGLLTIPFPVPPIVCNAVGVAQRDHGGEECDEACD